MKILAILGSRNPKGRTAQAVEALLDGVAAEGGKADRAFLPDMTLEHCRQCEPSGWGLCRTDGHCVIQDDLPQLVDRIAASDAVVFGVPVYFSDLSESMRALTDRLRRICRTEEGPGGIQGKKAVGVCVAGGGGGGAPACAVSLERVLSACGFEVIDVIPARRQNLDHKLRVLRMTGEWLAGQIL